MEISQLKEVLSDNEVFIKSSDGRQFFLDINSALNKLSHDEVIITALMTIFLY